MSSKSFIENNIEKILKTKNLTIYSVSKEIKVKDNALYEMVKGRSKFSDKFMKKILPILEVSKEEFQSWVLADKYSKELLELAIQAKKDFPYKRKSILTTKIDTILEHAGMSRTALAKQIKYSQSGLNRMIIGQISMSKPVLKKVAETLEIPENEILSWILADKYLLQVLEMAVASSLKQKDVGLIE